MKVTLVVLGGLAVAASAALAGPPTLTDLSIARDGENYVASCRLERGLTPQLLEEIDAGLETTIEYRLQLYRRRAGLPNQLIAKRRVRCTVRHDALRRQYTLVRRIDEEIEDTRVTSDLEAMREFMTTLKDVPIVRAEDLAPGLEYYLKAKSNIGLVWRFYLIPWPLDTAWVRVPLGTPNGSSRDQRP